MKRKNFISLMVICLLLLCILSGLIVYAFDLQSKRDSQSQNDTYATPEPTKSAVLADEPDRDLNEPTPLPSVTAVPSPTTAPAEDTTKNNEPIILTFAGDVNLDEASYPVKKYDSKGKDIAKCLSKDVLKEMREADIMMLNNEFAYSKRGTKTPDKSYTFLADPSRVDILKEMGVDIVSLANNHALDYGPDALEDTFTTLEDAGIDYVGAGENMARAKAPVYYTIGDKTIAFVAASRVVYAVSWYASENGLGMVGTYDPALILESIKEAKANSDYVVIYVHWGVERENYPVKYQRELAQKYIDAGADAVIGCHPHVMQGVEFYKGKPIAYSLGNFWFNRSTRESGMLKIYLDPDDTVRVQLLPAMNKNTYTYLLEDQEKADYYDFIREISFNVSIDEDGFITETTEQ